MNDFVLEYYEEEERQHIQFHYSISAKGYLYVHVAKEDGTIYPKKRISEKRFVSALEEYYNA